MPSRSWSWTARSILRSGRSASNGLRRRELPNRVNVMTHTTLNAQSRVNGQDEPLIATTLAALLAKKTVDVAQKGIAVALNGAVVPRAAWSTTRLNPGDSVEIVRARQGG